MKMKIYLMFGLTMASAALSTQGQSPASFIKDVALCIAVGGAYLTKWDPAKIKSYSDAILFCGGAEGLCAIVHTWMGRNLADYTSVLQEPLYKYLVIRLFLAVTLEKGDNLLQSYQQDALSQDRYKAWREKFREEIFLPLSSWCDQCAIGYGLVTGISAIQTLAANDAS